MGFGTEWFGLSWYGIGAGYSTYPLSAGGFIADLKSLAINAGGTVSGSKSISINAIGAIAELKGPTSIFASANIASLLGPVSINAGGIIAELKGPESINASARVAQLQSLSINASAYVAQLLSTEIYASGLVWGESMCIVNAGGLIAEQKTPHSINASAIVAQSRQNYVNAIGRVALKSQMAINASGLIIGWSVYPLNAYGNIGEYQIGSINASALVAIRTSGYIFAEGNVAEIKSQSLNVGGCLAGLISHPINAVGSVSQIGGPSSLNASGKIAIKLDQVINASAVVSQQNTLIIDASAHVGEWSFASLNARGTIALPAGNYYISASGLIIASPYYYLNDVDITDVMLEGLKPRGPDRKLSRKYYPGQEKVLISDDGFDVKEYNFETYFNNEASAFDYIEGVMDNSGDMKFYPGDSLWFHKVAFINVQRARRRGSYYFVLNNTVTLAKPWLYLNLATAWNSGSITLPRTSTDISNNGHYDTPLELLKITGHYSAGYPLALTYAIMDGVNQISALYLVDKLLSEEIIELDEDGILQSTYTDDYASSTRWGNDAVQSGCACAGGKVTIATGGYYYYRFRGPWPCIENISLLSKINIISGSPVIEVSNDGMATWQTAVATADIGNNISKTYYMIGSDHYADIYVRFRCPSGASIEVEDVSFVARRRTTGTTTPTIAAGNTRQIKISDGAGSTHSVSIEATFRERRRAI